MKKVVFVAVLISPLLFGQSKKVKIVKKTKHQIHEKADRVQMQLNQRQKAIDRMDSLINLIKIDTTNNKKQCRIIDTKKAMKIMKIDSTKQDLTDKE